MSYKNQYLSIRVYMLLIIAISVVAYVFTLNTKSGGTVFDIGSYEQTQEGQVAGTRDVNNGDTFVEISSGTNTREGSVKTGKESTTTPTSQPSAAPTEDPDPSSSAVIKTSVTVINPEWNESSPSEAK